MRPAVRIEGAQLVIAGGEEVLTGRHRSQLAYWGFAADQSSGRLVASPVDVHSTLDKVLSYFGKHGIAHEVAHEVAESRAALNALRDQLRKAIERGARLKNGRLAAADSATFLSLVAERIPRKLKEHQLKAALHLLAVTHGANFSVPGSGKTTVVLAVFA